MAQSWRGERKGPGLASNRQTGSWMIRVWRVPAGNSMESPACNPYRPSTMPSSLKVRQRYAAMGKVDLPLLAMAMENNYLSLDGRPVQSLHAITVVGMPEFMGAQAGGAAASVSKVNRRSRSSICTALLHVG